MRILFITTYVTNNSIPLLSQCKAGFGYMVYDIASSLSKKADVEVLLNNYRYEELESGGIKFLAATWGLFLKNIFKCSSPMIVFKLWRKYHIPLRTLVRLIYVWLISGYYYDVIHKGKYDVVHIHGCGYYDEFWMNICRRLNQKFVITLHGLNSFSDSVKLSPDGKRYEQDFLKRVAEGVFPITVISSGIKNLIEKTFGAPHRNNIYVVCNSFSFTETENRNSTIDIKKYYNLPDYAKIVLYVGNLCQRKNQKSIIDAFPYLSSELADKTYFLFMGRNIESDYELDQYIEKSKFRKHFILCGNVEKQDVQYYYNQSDAVALFSISEGFGLSLIEGMYFGKPCITFSDLDAFCDIYDDKVVVAVCNRSDIEVAKGLESLLCSDWDADYIRAYSHKFDSQQMAENYISVYQSIG